MNKNYIEPNLENDFGFTVEAEVTEPLDIAKVKKDVQALEDLILPLLENLRDSADKGDTIKWPNRKEVLTKQIDKIKKITKEYK